MDQNGETISTTVTQLSIPSPSYFPSDVLKWMKLNAKPKMALKLMKVCKFFEHQGGFPFSVYKKVNLTGNTWILETLDDQTITIEDLDEIPKKMWLVEKIRIIVEPESISTLLLKTAVFDLRVIQVTSNHHIKMNEFKYLTDGGNVEKCTMVETFITNDFDEIVPLEDICECLPNARRITIGSQCPIISSLKAAETKISSKLEKLQLWILPHNFNLENFSIYMKCHQQIKYWFWICGITSREFAETFKPMIEKFIPE